MAYIILNRFGLSQLLFLLNQCDKADLHRMHLERAQLEKQQLEGLMVYVVLID